MLDLQMLKSMPDGCIFATGTMFDIKDGLHITGSGRELRWIAKRGQINDWTIYCHFSNMGMGEISRIGDKITMEHHIKMLVPCSDEAFLMYRY